VVIVDDTAATAVVVVVVIVVIIIAVIVQGLVNVEITIEAFSASRGCCSRFLQGFAEGDSFLLKSKSIPFRSIPFHLKKSSVMISLVRYDIVSNSRQKQRRKDIDS
jgi:hypothetical protein